MLTSALPTSGANPVNGNFNSPSSNGPNGSADGAPDGFARLLDQASKPETGISPDKPASTSGSNGGQNSSSGSGSDAEGGTQGVDPSTVDIRPAPWPAGSKPSKGQHPPVPPPPGHIPGRLPPVPGDDPAPGEALDTLTFAAGVADGCTDASPLDTAAAAAGTPAAPTPDSASALLAAWNAGAATAATGGAARNGADRVSYALDSEAASGDAAVAALASTATRLSRARGGLPAEVPGDTQGDGRGNAHDTGADAGFGASLDPADGARGSSLANRADRKPAVANTAARTTDLDGATASAIADIGDSSPAGRAASTRAAATGRRGAAAEATSQSAERSTRQAAAQTASELAHDATARAVDPLSGVAGDSGLAGGSRTSALQAPIRSGGTGTGWPNTSRGTSASASPEASAGRIGAATDGSARGDADGAREAGSLSPAFNIDSRAGAGARTQALADLHGGVATASAQAASAAAAALALASSREAGALPRSTESERGGPAHAEGATGAGGVPMGSALAWVSGSAAGTAVQAAASDGRIAASPGSADFAPQLAAHISTFVRDGLLHARLELNPGDMGPLTVQIQLDGNAARVHLAAEHAGTRAALEQAMPQLAGSLRENGLTLSGGGVFEQPRQPQAQAGDGSSDNRNNGGSAHDGPGDGRRSGTSDAMLGNVTGSAAVGGRRRAGVVDLVA
jgi:flagellar hook-length control protein FliK